MRPPTYYVTFLILLYSACKILGSGQKTEKIKLPLKGCGTYQVIIIYVTNYLIACSSTKTKTKTKTKAKAKAFVCSFMF